MCVCVILGVFKIVCVCVCCVCVWCVCVVCCVGCLQLCVLCVLCVCCVLCVLVFVLLCVAVCVWLPWTAPSAGPPLRRTAPPLDRPSAGPPKISLFFPSPTTSFALLHSLSLGVCSLNVGGDF